MDILWAPWRMKYIEYAKIEKDAECFICKAFTAADPNEHLVLFKTPRTIVVMNKYPYNTGHLLVAPARHVPDFSSLTKDELHELVEVLRESVDILKRALNPDGFNIGVNLGRVAGAGLESHLHVHVVPRWLGDTNFMPVISNTKVIPESLQDTFIKIKKYVNYHNRV
ncbi:MAG: HIT domain-containing protein [Thermofilaceae archaeon]